MTNEKEMTQEEALAWASIRKAEDETVTIAKCPCCGNFIAVYVKQSGRQEIVPPPIDAGLSAR